MLTEVVVKGESEAKPKPLHYGKANSVAEGVLLVSEGEDNLPSASFILRRGLDLGDKMQTIGQKGTTYLRAQGTENGGMRFHNDIVGCVEPITGR